MRSTRSSKRFFSSVSCSFLSTQASSSRLTWFNFRATFWRSRHRGRVNAGRSAGSRQGSERASARTHARTHATRRTEELHSVVSLCHRPFFLRALGPRKVRFQSPEPPLGLDAHVCGQRILRGAVSVGRDTCARTRAWKMTDFRQQPPRLPQCGLDLLHARHRLLTCVLIGLSSLERCTGFLCIVDLRLGCRSVRFSVVLGSSRRWHCRCIRRQTVREV